MVGMIGTRMRSYTLACAGVAFVACLFLWHPLHVGAATRTVTNCTDSGVSGDGSLRGEIAAAGSGDTISFTAGLNCTSGGAGPIVVGSTLTLAQNVTIDGTGATIAVDGGYTGGNTGVQVFAVNSAVTASLNTLTIQHGKAGDGGGILNNGGTLTVTNSTLSGNSATNGGGIYNNGTLTVTNSTFSGNSATNDGGGILNNSGMLTVTNSTLAGNSAAIGGGILNAGTLTVTNSTLAGNSAGGGGGILNFGTVTVTNVIVATSPTGRDLTGTFGGSNNLIDDSSGTLTGTGNRTNTPALLGPLGTYGNPNGTQTFALLPGSPAIDAGAAVGSGPAGNLVPATDQRGVARPQGAGVDIGAFESQGFTLAKTSGDGQSVPVSTAFAPLVVTVAPSAAGLADNEPINGGVVTFTGPGSGADITPDPQTATIGATTSGQARLTPTANGTPGKYTVTAATTGATNATFTLTNNAAACIVNSAMDPTETGKTTLRGAVAILNSGGCTNDTITFDPAVFPPATPQTITLAAGSGTLTLAFTTRPVTINGASAGVVVDGGCTTDANGNCTGGGVTVFTVNGGVTATINALTIQHGFTASRNGGGIFNAGGALTVTNSTLVANSSAGGGGGGIDNQGALTVTNSTFSGNSASVFGGGISNANGQPLTVTNSTFSGNSAGNSGGGIFTGGRATLTNTLVAASPNGGDLAAYSISGGAFTGTNNLIDDAASAGGFTDGANGNIVGHPALLGPLGNYGGPTQTIPLLPGSPAIDAGTSTGAPATDQRGKPRVNAPDIGAFESQGFTLTPAAGSTRQSTLVNTQFPQSLAVTVAANNPGEPVAGGVVTYTVNPVNGATATLSAGTATISGSGMASVTATANGTPGAYTVTAAANATFNLTNTPPTITLSPPTLPNGMAEQPYGPVTLTASGGTAPYTFAVTSGTLPTGLTLNATTGVLSGTPTQAGSFPITVTATDANRFTGSQAYTLTIAAPAGITLSPTTLPGGMKGVAYPSQTLTASGGVAPYTFTVTMGALPGGLTLTPAGGLSGTPTATGTFSFTVTATDHNGFTGTQTYAITITAAPLVSITIAPMGGGNPTLKVGQSVTFVATGTYADGSTQPLPAVQVTWRGSNAQVATVDPMTGKVTGESPGTIQLTATDGNVTQTITVTVSGPTPIGIVVGPAPASRPGGASAVGSGGTTPAPSAPSRGGGGSGSAPAPLPPGR